MDGAFPQPAIQVALSLDVDPDPGLAATQASLARKKYGDNYKF